MFKLDLLNVENGLKMVKNKRDLKSPRRNRSFTGTRPISRVRPTSSGKGGNIRVIVRVRPPSNREQGENFSNVVKIIDDNTMVFDPKEENEPFFYHGVQQRHRDIMKRANKDLQFTFDRVFSHEANNNDVFECTTKELIKTLMNGYNCSVFVYGATGAGKTHTMLGRGDDPGITFQTMTELFKEKDELSQDRHFEIGVTYLEVYNETVQDLLNPGPALELRENGQYGVIVAGIQVHRIDKSEKLFDLLEQGNKNRTQHPTDANAESSRSHAVFQVYLRMKIISTNEIRLAKLSMIDLAGSERGAATGYSGARFTEGANINKSLLALGNCINSLADGQRYVPYRDSKLTRLLKDSLGGNCQTVMIANVSPSSLSYEDTYNTLKYAMRAKNIKSNMKKNIVNSDRNLNHYVNLVDELTKENEKLKLELSLLSQKKDNETVTKDEPDPKLQTDLQALYAEKRELEQRILQLESTEQLQNLRKRLKEESDARLSGICSDTPDREFGHRRFGNAIDRLERQTANLQKDLVLLRERSEQLEVRLKQFIETAPHLKQVAKLEDYQIAYIKANSKAECLQKVSDLQEGEMRMCYQLIESFSKVLKPTILQLRGHGLASEALLSEYQGLVRQLQGIRSVTWDDESTAPTPIPSADSGISSCTDVTVESEENTSNKQKLLEELNNTFTLPQEKPQTISAEKFMAKVYQSSKPEGTSAVAPLNRKQVLSQNKQQSVSARNLMAKVYKSNKPIKTNTMSPRNLKENKFQYGTTKMMPAIIGHDKNKITKKYKPRALSAGRPPNVPK
ncbi:hypothetical protein ILUMI_13404 [Ignelater luminosus]|uniref:Kinesin-like protein n=1 Tax=Ignelater luminosus TaxID=2038154 RepID=A0A8K0GAY1_IGNLU|nr:hypothetical protein ILUMI_13404 [Ignelater luminosus]